jgi:chemotaxis protein histidine kinase CheA
MLQITLRDDGRGSTSSGCGQGGGETAVGRGMAAADEAELLEFLFLPGFSTASR